MISRDKSIAAIMTVAEGLHPLVEPVVFVGGATVGLYIDTAAVPEIRMTLDVDCVVEVTPVQMAQLSEKLIAADFEPTPPVICRYRYRGVVVDIMPTDPRVLGFSNRWYQEAIKHRQAYRLDSTHVIEIFSFPYFLATKMEAFKGRGSSDWLASSDLEDIVAVLDGRSTAEDELVATHGLLGDYLRGEFATMLSATDLDDVLAGHLGAYPGRLSQQRAKRVRGLMERIKAG